MIKRGSTVLNGHMKLKTSAGEIGDPVIIRRRDGEWVLTNLITRKRFNTPVATIRAAVYITEQH